MSSAPIIKTYRDFPISGKGSTSEPRNTRPVWNLDAEGLRVDDEELVREASLELVINRRSYTVLMSTPGADLELVAGFLFTEGLINSTRDLGSVEFLPEDPSGENPNQRVLIELPGLDPAGPIERNGPLCRTASGGPSRRPDRRLQEELKPVSGGQSFTRETILTAHGDLIAHQPLYERTRGVHAAALHQNDGSFCCCQEDVGRHNALDKVIGQALLSGWRLADKLLVLSGRASLEMIVKAARAGLPLVVCSSSPTALAVQAADDMNLTLVKPRKDQSLLIYTHPDRFRGPEKESAPLD